MSRSLSMPLVVAASLSLAACGGPDPQPLAAFTAYELSTDTHAWVKDGGGHDADYYQVALILHPPPHDSSVGYSCLAISPKVIATMDGEVMHSYATGSGPSLGGCTNPVFSLNVPKERYGEGGGNATFILSDATHTMTAEFKDFYVLYSESGVLLTLKCEGMAKCTGYTASKYLP